jgi:hypothetical protein
MEIIAAWVIFSFIVAAAAGARGRSGAGWFLLAIVISPILALIFVLVIPNLAEEQKARHLAEIDRNLRPAPSNREAGRAGAGRSKGPFEPDGVFGGFPYRVNEDGSILAIMQGAEVKFGNMDRFVSAVNPQQSTR